jgi:hypothetical protein
VTDKEIEAMVEDRFHPDRVECVDGRVTIETRELSNQLTGGDAAERYLGLWLEDCQISSEGGCDSCGYDTLFTITGTVRPGVELPAGSPWGWK